MRNGKKAPQKMTEDNSQAIILSDDIDVQSIQSLEMVFAGKNSALELLGDSNKEADSAACHRSNAVEISTIIGSARCREVEYIVVERS
jgi:hypothetical protein